MTPRAHVRPYDIPYNLREPMNRELSDAIEAGVLTPCNSHSDWVHQMFPVPKPGNTEVRLVSDFKRLNSALQRPAYPVESNSQLLRHLHPDSRVFCTLDMTSGYQGVVISDLPAGQI